MNRSLTTALLLALTAAPLASAAEAVPAHIRAIHERMLVLDTHLDTPAQLDNPAWNILERHTPTPGNDQVDYPRMVEGGLDGGLWAVYTPQTGQTPADYRAARDHALRRLANIHKLLAAHPDKFELALTADDASRIAAAGRRVVYISLENAAPLTPDASLLQDLHAQGVRVLGLVHTANNEFADSASALPRWHGLSAAGRALVAEANRRGLVIDPSHASNAVFDQVLELSRAPVILSHSGASAIYDHPRNIDDDRIRALAAKGGVVFVNSLGAYLKDTGESPLYRQAVRELHAKYRNSPPGPERDAEVARAQAALDAEYKLDPATFEDYFAHVLHFLKLVGPDHVGFGPDWDGGGGVVGLEDVSLLPKVTERLLREGYTEAQIAGMWSGNLLRVMRQVQALAAQPDTARSP